MLSVFGIVIDVGTVVVVIVVTVGVVSIVAIFGSVVFVPDGSIEVLVPGNNNAIGMATTMATRMIHPMILYFDMPEMIIILSI